MSTMSRLQKRIADGLMKGVIKQHIEKEYFKKGITPTIEQVLQDIPSEKMLALLQSGYTKEEIAEMIEGIIRRKR